ncbi:hypothetical protein RB195_019655 [Necator americanus]|uniref:Uncharacterized protein n=1 Tax=Necator americanus TaxID=51031 RepID=A0ABR1CF72_NECAM
MKENAYSACNTKVNTSDQNADRTTMFSEHQLVLLCYATLKAQHEIDDVKISPRKDMARDVDHECGCDQAQFPLIAPKDSVKNGLTDRIFQRDTQERVKYAGARMNICKRANN